MLIFIVKCCIFIAHILLVYWMYFVLSQAGLMDAQTIAIHFIGMAILGAFLIRFAAYFYKRITLHD